METTEFQHFSSELRAAVTADAPLEVHSSDSHSFGGLLTEDQLDRLESAAVSRLTDEEFWNEANDSDGGIPACYRAALCIYRQTGMMQPVLEGLSARRLAIQQALRITRWAFFYLLLLLGITCVGLLFFNLKVAPMIDAMKVDIRPEAYLAEEPADSASWIPTIVIVIVATLFGFLVWTIAGGATQVVMWLGGRNYVRFQVSVAALDAMKSMVGQGADFDSSMRSSCELAGVDLKGRARIKSALNGSETNIQQINDLAAYLTHCANRQLAYLKIASPVAVVAIIGGGIAALFGVAVFWPVYSLLRDIAGMGI